MSHNLQTFTFTLGEIAHAVRVVMRDGEPWFVAIDVCRALDLGNITMALDRVDSDEKTFSSNEGIHVGPGNPNVALINEPGLYSLVLGSRKPEAKPFKRWVTHEVLPSIARHGAYIDPDNRMGETLGSATAGALGIERDDDAVTDSLRALTAAVLKLGERFDNREHQMRAMRQEYARSLGKIVRIAKAQRQNPRNLDPNRPLTEEDVERFKYLLTTGATVKQIARSLNRTYAVIHRFIEQNQDLVLRALQQPLL